MWCSVFPETSDCTYSLSDFACTTNFRRSNLPNETFNLQIGPAWHRCCMQNCDSRMIRGRAQTWVIWCFGEEIAARAAQTTALRHHTRSDLLIFIKPHLPFRSCRRTCGCRCCLHQQDKACFRSLRTHANLLSTELSQSQVPVNPLSSYEKRRVKRFSLSLWVPFSSRTSRSSARTLPFSYVINPAGILLTLSSTL